MSNNPKYQFVPIVAVFAKLTRDLGLNQVDESDVIEWTGEALEAIGSVPMYEDAVAFAEVKNHQCEIPNGSLQIEQIGRNKCWHGPQIDTLCGAPATILTEIMQTNQFNGSGNCNGCNTLPIPLDCNGQPLMDYNIAYYRPYYDLQAEYYGWSWRGSPLSRQCFTPVRLSTNTMFLGDNMNFNGGQQIADPYIRGGCQGGCYDDEYIVIKKKILRFSFKDGQVAISYKRQAIDPETGYPLIPDSFSHKTAITKYITMMMMSREFYSGREGAKGRLDKAEADWQWYCKQASSMDLMPWGVDEYQNLYDQRTRLLPNNKQYYSFFGKMNIPEGRKWDDPDHRNYAVNYFRGSGGYAF